jgi:hypothetical protein
MFKDILKSPDPLSLVTYGKAKKHHETSREKKVRKRGERSELLREKQPMETARLISSVAIHILPE